MKLLRPLVVIACLLILLVATALWWSSPVEADMAEYAPADSLVYLEVNSISDITKAIQQTEVLKAVSRIVGMNPQPQNGWAFVAARAGLGPAEAVISSRSQMALAVVNVNTEEKDELLRVKPEVAFVVETHTSKWRMKGSAVAGIKQLAQFAYGDAICSERSAEADYIECIEPRGSRRIVGAIEGSVVIVGNSAKAVETCLEVRRGQRPSLHTDPELLRARASLKSESALAFGYVSQANAAKLFSWIAPLLFGKAPGDQQLEGLLAKSASRILGGIAWTSKSINGGIEDRYLISLEPEVIKRLEPAFETANAEEDFWKLVPDSFRSLTVYRSKDPQAAWFSLDSAVAMKLDAVSTVIFASLLKSGLSGYSIEDPKAVLGAMGSPVLTFRPTLGDGSLLLARVKNEEHLRKALANDLLKGGKGQILTGSRSEPDKEKEFTAVFVDGFVILGKTESMRIYLTQLQNNEMVTPEHLENLKLSNRQDSSATVTFTNERASVAMIIRALSRLTGHALSENQWSAINNQLDNVKVACTESTLNENGIERRTQSAFGQFGNLLSLAEADSSNNNQR